MCLVLQEGSLEVLPGLFLQRDLTALAGLFSEGRAEAREVVAVVGHTGWGPGQLQGEVNMATWLAVDVADDRARCSELGRQLVAWKADDGVSSSVRTGRAGMPAQGLAC